MALADEFSVLRTAVLDRACEPPGEALEPITDVELLEDPVETVASLQPSFASVED